MPVRSFIELNEPRHRPLNTSASDHTRAVRLLATVAPYIRPGQQLQAPTLGWKSPALNAEVRTIAPIYGIVNSFLPNRR
jgi:hypothetical protein